MGLDCLGAEQQRLAAQEPPLQAMLETIAQIVAQATAPAPEGGPGARRRKAHVAPDRRIAMEDADMRHGRKRSSQTFHGFNEPVALDVDRTGTREEVVCPANQPEHEAVALLAEELEQGAGLGQLDRDPGEMARPRIAQWADQGVPIRARPGPQGGPLFTPEDFTPDVASRRVPGPQRQTVPMIPGRATQCPAAACDACAVRTPGTPATLGHGRSLRIRADAQVQQKRRAQIKTQRGRASLWKRTAVEHAISQQVAPQGRRARYKGRRKTPFDGRRHAAVSNLQVAARYAEERQLAS